MAPTKSIMTPRDSRLRYGLHHPVSMNRCRCSTSFHYTFISFRIRIWNNQFYNSEYVRNMFELLFSLCYPWISFNLSIKVWLELQKKINIISVIWTFPLLISFLGYWILYWSCKNLQVDLSIPNLKVMCTALRGTGRSRFVKKEQLLIEINKWN